MAERMNDYTERVKAEKGEVVPAKRTALESENRRKAADRTEEGVIDQLRTNLSRAAEIEADLLERLPDAQQRDLPAALRAASDVKSKSLDGLLKLTGRAAADPDAVSLHELVVSMARKGFIRASVNLDIGEPNDD